jgi:hypothetical protein
MNELHYFGYISTAIILHCGLVDNTTLLQTDKRGAACQVSLMQYTVQYLKLLLSCIFLLSEIPYTHCMVGCKEIFSTFQSFYFIHYSPPTRSATGWMILYFGFCNNFFWLISMVWQVFGGYVSLLEGAHEKPKIVCTLLTGLWKKW